MLVHFVLVHLVRLGMDLTYLPTYLPTYIPTYLPTYLHTCLHTYLPTYLPTYLHTYLPPYLHTYPVAYTQDRAHDTVLYHVCPPLLAQMNLSPLYAPL